MGRNSKSVENFLRSIDEYYENEAKMASVRIFRDELYVFGEVRSAGGRRRPDDYIILGDRRRGESLVGTSLPRSLLGSRTDELYSAIDSRKSFAVINCGGKAAILYLGLFGSCRVGIMSLTAHSACVIASAMADDLGCIFGGIWVSDAIRSVGGEGDPRGFINDFMMFKSEVLSACGIEGLHAFVGLEEMLFSVSELVGCNIEIMGRGPIVEERVERETSAAMFFCLLSAIRSASEDRCAFIRVREYDGDAVIDLTFKPYGELPEDSLPFAEFCRSFSERHGIPFSYESANGKCSVSFIPVRIDPSAGGLKASVPFDVNQPKQRKDFHYGH